MGEMQDKMNHERMVKPKEPARHETPEQLLLMRVVKIFEAAGWRCDTKPENLRFSNGMPFKPDLKISNGNSFCGYVEIYLPHRDKIEKMKYVLGILKTFNPELFILTNGESYEVYFDGKYKGSMTVPLECHSYCKIRERMAKEESDSEVADDENVK